MDSSKANRIIFSRGIVSAYHFLQHNRSQGGVVESLYGATQAIVDKAHKGAGMSQTGAYAYANQGYDYQQILAEYYPGVEISRLKEN